MPMKMNVISILRETVIVLALAAFGTLFVLVVGVVSRMSVSHQLLRLMILGLMYMLASFGAMLVFGTRKLWVLSIRAVVSGAIAAALMVAAAESRYKDVLVLAKVALGEGGIVHRVGEACLRSPGCTNTYSVYRGNVKYADGSDMRELILFADDPMKNGFGIRRSQLLIGKSRILIAHGLLELRSFSGQHAVVTCLGGLDVTSPKVGWNVWLKITDSGRVRTYRSIQRECDGTSSRPTLRTHYLDVPLSCFPDEGDDPHEDDVSVDAEGDDWTAAAKLISGTNFLGRALGDKMPAGDEYEIKLEKPFLFLPRASYFGAADGGTVRIKGCMFHFKSPDAEYAIEHVLSPVTNALISVYGVPLSMSPKTESDGCWMRCFSAAHKGLDVEIYVNLNGHRSRKDDGYEVCLLTVDVMDACVRRFASMECCSAWEKSRFGYHGDRDTIAVDEWHELSADSLDRRWLFSRSDILRLPGGSHIKTPDGKKGLSEYVTKTFGIPFGVDVRTIDGFGGESLSPVGGKFLALEPNCEIATNGWRLTGVNVNGRSLTVFGGTVRREFLDEAAAKSDLRRVIDEIEVAANISMRMSMSADDRILASLSPSSDPFIEIERIKTAEDGSASYQVHVRRRSFMRLRYVTTASGCSSSPE